MTAASIETRYKEGGDNKLLRHVLCLAWDHQCYWCRHFKEYLDLEIDHILPKTSTKQERTRLERAFQLADEFDVHALYNLAPICGACNQQKGDFDFTEYGMVLTALRKAQRLAPKVTRQVQAFGKPSKLAGALLEAAEADLSDEATRAAFAHGAPAVIQRLAELGSGKADYFTFKTLEVDVSDKFHQVSLKVNEAGRAALLILERVAGGCLEKALEAPLGDLLGRIASESESDFGGRDEGISALDVGPAEINWIEVTIDRIDFEGNPPAQLEFVFAGAFEGMISASIARDDASGELEYVQGDALLGGRHVFTLSWDPSDAIGNFSFDRTWLEGWEAELWVEGHGSRG